MLDQTRPACVSLRPLGWACRQLLFTLLAAMLLLSHRSLWAQSCPKAGDKGTYWSKQAVEVCWDKATDQLHLEAPSPAGKKLLYVNGPAHTASFYLKSDHEGAPQELYAAFAGAEVLWSPDSKAVAITTCFGGNGPCSVDTIQVDDNEAQLDDSRRSPFEIVQDAFAIGHEGDVCHTEANVGALTWQDGSDKIVLIAEVPTAHCDGGGYFEAFVVSFSERKVISRFNMQETLHRWHSILGSGLRNDIALVREDAKLRKK